MAKIIYDHVLFHYPYAPSMEYFPTFARTKSPSFVVRYTIHGASGLLLQVASWMFVPFLKITAVSLEPFHAILKKMPNPSVSRSLYPLVIEHNYGKSPFLMGKSTISMAIFNSYVDITRGYATCLGFPLFYAMTWGWECIPCREKMDIFGGSSQ